MTGDSRPVVARVLGYKTEASLRQCERGEAVLPSCKAALLEAYAKFRAKQNAALSAWLKKNAPEGENNG